MQTLDGTSNPERSRLVALRARGAGEERGALLDALAASEDAGLRGLAVLGAAVAGDAARVERACDDASLGGRVTAFATAARLLDGARLAERLVDADAVS